MSDAQKARIVLTCINSTVKVTHLANLCLVFRFYPLVHQLQDFNIILKHIMDWGLENPVIFNCQVGFGWLWHRAGCCFLAAAAAACGL